MACCWEQAGCGVCPRVEVSQAVQAVEERSPDSLWRCQVEGVQCNVSALRVVLLQCGAACLPGCHTAHTAVGAHKQWPALTSRCRSIGPVAQQMYGRSDKAAA